MNHVLQRGKAQMWHGLHAVVAGPDPRRYFNAGNADPNVVSDGLDGRPAPAAYVGGCPYNTVADSVEEAVAPLVRQ